MHSTDRMIYFLRTTHLAYRNTEKKREENINRDREPERMSTERENCANFAFCLALGAVLLTGLKRYIQCISIERLLLLLVERTALRRLTFMCIKKLHHKDTIRIVVHLLDLDSFKLVPLFLYYNLEKLIESMCSNSIYIFHFNEDV